MGSLKRAALAALAPDPDKASGSPGTPSFTDGLMAAFGKAAEQAVDDARRAGVPVAGRQEGCQEGRHEGGRVVDMEPDRPARSKGANRGVVKTSRRRRS